MFAALLGRVLMTYIATSGACATIASDAFMNPFDGTRPLDIVSKIVS